MILLQLFDGGSWMVRETDTAAHTSSRSIAAMALGFPLVLLGLLSVASGDFAFQWQPVPLDIAHRPEIARFSGALLAGSAFAMPLVRGRSGTLALAAILSVWVVVLQLPRAVATPGDFTAWLGVAEISAIAIGAWTVHLGGIVTGAEQDRAPPITARLFGITLIVFGASHFLYAQFTATMVPGFLPFPLFLVYLTGAVHAGTGLMLLFGWFLRAAAGLEAAMMASFAALVHVPRVSKSPSSRLEWTMLVIALALTGSAMIVRAWSTNGGRPLRYSQMLGTGL